MCMFVLVMLSSKRITYYISYFLLYVYVVSVSVYACMSYGCFGFEFSSYILQVLLDPSFKCSFLETVQMAIDIASGVLYLHQVRMYVCKMYECVYVSTYGIYVLVCFGVVYVMYGM